MKDIVIPRPLGKGLVIYGSRDRRTVEDEFARYQSIRRETALERLEATVFLGEAFDLVYKKPAPDDGQTGFGGIRASQ